MNAYVHALTALTAHIDAALTSNRDIAAIRKELLKKDKAELVELLIVHMKAEKVKSGNIARAILEDENCTILTYAEIAAAITDRVPNAETSDKTIASYASKNKAIWAIKPRKTTTERNNAIREMAGLVATTK